MKETMKVWRPKLSFLVTLPQAEIGLTSAPAKRGPEVAAEDLCGNTETAAPVSTRNCCLVTESLRKMRPPRALSCPRRRPSFPPNHNFHGSSWPQPRTSCESSKYSYHPTVQVWGGGTAGGHRRGHHRDRATWRGGQETLRGGWAKRSELTRRRENLKQRRLTQCSWRPKVYRRELTSLSLLYGSPRRGGL